MRMSLASALALLVGCTATASAADPEVLVPALRDLVDALETCAPAAIEMPHPARASFMMVHTIDGEDAQGACGYTQTMPEDILISCGLSAEGRADLLGSWQRIQAMVETLTLLPPPPEGPIWIDDCVVVMADGETVPIRDMGWY